MIAEIQRETIKLNTIRREINATIARPFHSRKKLRSLQAAEEAQRDILNTTITQAQSTSSVVDKNNYRTYASQVNAAYKMYNAETAYGAEFMRGLVETRVAFISGEGLSISAKKKSTENFIERFLKGNKLNGSGLLKINEVGELEGKCLVALRPDPAKRIVKQDIFSWWENTYNVETKNGEYYRAVYKEKEGVEEQVISEKDSVYIKLGGTWAHQNLTPSKLHCVLTQIENASRAGYDLRRNSHLFGKSTPAWQVENRREADAINNTVSSKDWAIGTAYAGSGKMYYVEPTGGATSVNEKDLLLSLKAISTTLGIPIHWLAWPELMSNRATADNMLEMIGAGTRKERLLYEEGFYEIIEKAMRMSVDSGFEELGIIGDFTVKLPLISITMVKQLSETWLPLQQNDVIAMADLRDRIPGIDPMKTKRRVEEEKEENMENFSSVQEELNRRQQSENTDDEE